MPRFNEFAGHFEVVYSPDDGGYYADMWEDPDLDSGVLSSYTEARRWALANGGTTEHFSR